MTSFAASLSVAHWLERPTGIRKGHGMILSGIQNFSFFFVSQLARDTLNIPFFFIITKGAFHIT